MQLLRRPGFQDGETCQGESVSASLTDLASRDPANFPQADPIFSLKSMAPVAAGNAPAGTSGRRDDATGVPQIADDFGAPRKSAEVGHNQTLAQHLISRSRCL
jgi:hypothetical protein